MYRCHRLCGRLHRPLFRNEGLAVSNRRATALQIGYTSFQKKFERESRKKHWQMLWQTQGYYCIGAILSRVQSTCGFKARCSAHCIPGQQGASACSSLTANRCLLPARGLGTHPVLPSSLCNCHRPPSCASALTCPLPATATGLLPTPVPHPLHTPATSIPPAPPPSSSPATSLLPVTDTDLLPALVTSAGTCHASRALLRVQRQVNPHSPTACPTQVAGFVRIQCAKRGQARPLRQPQPLPLGCRQLPRHTVVLSLLLQIQ